MREVSSDEVKNLLISQFGVDIRDVEVDGERYTVTVSEGQPVVVCQWGELPDGGTFNGERVSWVRKWTSGDGPLPVEYEEVVALVL